MVINGKRIRKIQKYLIGIKEGDSFYVGCSDLAKHGNTLIKAGFTPALDVGDRLLPAPEFGPMSLFNAEGREIPLKDQSMETAYMQVDWEWKDWGGHWHSKICDRPYQRYPRLFIPPPSIELQISLDGNHNKFVSSDKLTYDEASREKIKHTLNLFFDIFGEFEIMTESLIPAMTAPVRSLNWEILPRGVFPWTRVKAQLAMLVEKAEKGNQPVINYRLEKINDAKPDFHAKGTAGFHGYIIFGFEAKNLYVLESIYYGNATYVFEENWEELSKKTKAEIISANLQRDRLIHREGWEGAIAEVLK